MVHEGIIFFALGAALQTYKKEECRFEYPPGSGRALARNTNDPGSNPGTLFTLFISHIIYQRLNNLKSINLYFLARKSIIN